MVWATAVVGNTVYAGGRFSNARPAGAAAGTSLTPRGNLLAFDITTGNLINSFAPSLYAQVLSVAAAPDGSRIYVVGDFGTANGQARKRVAAYSTATGALVTTFNPPGVSSQARTVVATNDTVYVGGGFRSAASGQARNNLTAFRASDGGLLPWNPNADSTVWALAITADGSSVFAGGSFQNVGGQSAYGLAKISAATGALDPTWKPSVRNAGPDAGISSLRVVPWTLGTTASNFSVQGGAGSMRMAAGSGPSALLNAVSAGNADALTSFGYDKAATGGGIYTSAVLRRSSAGDYRGAAQGDGHGHPQPAAHGQLGRHHHRVAGRARLGDGSR